MTPAVPMGLIQDTLRNVVYLLVQRDYAGLETITKSVRLRGHEIEKGVAEYGRTIVLPPAEAFSRIDIVPIRASVPPVYSIRFRLYTLEEGESDLELQATFILNESGGQMTVELDSILVA